jgi:hypothetical protein
MYDHACSLTELRIFNFFLVLVIDNSIVGFLRPIIDT